MIYEDAYAKAWQMLARAEGHMKVLPSNGPRPRTDRAAIIAELNTGDGHDTIAERLNITRALVSKVAMEQRRAA